MSIAAYRRTIRDSGTPRQIEQRVLSQVTTRLDLHAADFDTASDLSERLSHLAAGLRDALAENQAVWSALRADLMEPGNALPQALRAQLISIALWVDRHTHAVIGGAPGARALVAVNRSIVDGLAGRASAPAARVA